MKNVCLVITYFGKWPPWIDFFVRSCQFNPSVTWFIFTDCGVPECTSDNVKLINMTLKDFNARASEKLGFSISLTHPYKLCDLKPAYYAIFEEFLEQYDFWGHGDLDVIYGNLRAFLTEDFLRQYDVITIRKEAMAGHFSLFRNSQSTTRLFESSPVYRKIFQNTDRYYGFDEVSIPNAIEALPGKIGRRISSCLFPNRPIEVDGPNYFASSRSHNKDMTHVVKNKARNKELSLYHETLHTSRRWYKRRMMKGWSVQWDSGKLYDMSQQKEIMYYHFLLSTKTKTFHIPPFSPDISHFTITRDGIALDAPGAVEFL